MTCKEKETIGMGQGDKPASWVSGTTPLHSLNAPPKKNSNRWGQAPRHTISKTMGEVPTMGITGGVPKSLSP